MTLTGQQGHRQKGSNMDFTSLRADWKAQGCPADHAYLRMDLPTPSVEPLIDGITTEMVAAASAICAGLPERSYRS